MKKQQNLFAKIISLISYQKVNKPKSFILPEADEWRKQSGDERTGDSLQDNNASKEINSQAGKGQNNSPNSNEQNGNNLGGDGQNSKPDGNNQGKENESNELPSKDQVEGSSSRRGKKPLTAAQARSKRAGSDEVRADIESNLEVLKQQFHVPQNKDLVIREFKLGNKKRGFLTYLDGMADKNIINQYILRPLFTELSWETQEGARRNLSLENIIETNDVKKLNSIKKVIGEILKGNTALYLDGLDYILSCESIGFEKRGVEAPKTEGIVKGPQEGFNENLRTNISLLRRIIRNKELVTEFFEIGEKSNTTIAVVYLADVLNPKILQEVRRRLTNIKTDFLVSIGMLEELIEDNPYSIIPTVLNTERPDRVVANIVEGKVAILMDGAPIAIIVPVTINAMMHTSEDAALRWQHTTALRFIRFFAFAIATLLPGFYLALTTFHQEMIPTDLLIAIAKAKENVPFPTIVEVLVMELGFELIREAGVRIPGIIGNTLGIIGALILGEAAVSANIVSPILIIIVAATGLSNFAIPNYTLAFGVRITRFFFIFAGATLGFFGLALTAVGCILMLVNLKSFGVPLMSGIAPRSRKGRDQVLRWPLWMQGARPDYLNPQDRTRQPKIARQWAEQDAE